MRSAKQQYAKRQAEKFGRMAKYSLDEVNQKMYESKSRNWKNVASSSVFGIINTSDAKEVIEVHSIGKIDREIYKCITEDIITDEVIITDNQIQHIKDRHPDAYEKTLSDMENTIKAPDYIIADDKHKNTGLVVKRIENEEGSLQLVLRICTSQDEPGYKNSVISCWVISERRLQNYLRNKRILYKKE